MNKSLIRTSNGDLKYCSMKKPLVKDAEVLIKLGYVGVCGTDLQILRGLRSDSAIIIGHEAIGEIVEKGRNLSTFNVGDKVTFNPNSLSNQNRILGHSMQGVFQQYILLNYLDIEQGMLEKIDDDIPYWAGALIEPLASVIYAHELIRQVSPMQSVAIFGAGTMGLLHALHLRLHGIKQVFLIHPNSRRLNWALQRKCIESTSAITTKCRPIEQVLERTLTEGVDVALICTPRDASLEALNTALQLIKPGGCIDLVGGFETDAKSFELPNINFTEIRKANFCGKPQIGSIKKITTISDRSIMLTGHRGVSKRHLQQSIRYLKQSPHWYSRLITHTVSLQAAEYVLNKFRQDGIRRIKNEEWVKLAIDCRRSDFSIKTNNFFPNSILCS